MDPVKTAYQATGPHPSSIGQPGVCARCSDHAPLTPTREVVSSTFTGFDGWSGPPGGLCPACTWAFTDAQLRKLAHLVSTTPLACAPLATGEALALLSRGALPASHALSIPLRPGRKHVFAATRWAAIATDDATLTWSAHDASRLQIMNELRARGATGGQLQQAAPPYQWLSKQPKTDWALMHTWWAALTSWRKAQPWFRLGLALTNRPAC